MTRVSNSDVFSDAFSPASPEKTDKRDKETFGQPDQKGLPPRSYFDSVAQRSQALEKQRKKKPEEELKDKAPTGEDFLASTKEPVYQSRHCFFEEEFGEDGEEGEEGDVFYEAQDGGPKVITKPAESPTYVPSSCEVEEIREAAPTAEDGTPDKQRPATTSEEQQMQRMLDDFGFVKGQGKKEDASLAGLGEAAYTNSLDHSDLRQTIRKAMKDQDEVALNEAVDRARDLQAAYPWTNELNEAEDLLYELLQCPAEPLPKHEEEDHGF